MKKILPLLFCTTLFSAPVLAQDDVVPASYELKTKDDYAKYEKQVIAAANWLQATPLNEQPDRRKLVGAFVLQWVSGSPTVNVEIHPVLLDFEKKNEGMLILYMAASARYVLEHKDRNDVRAKQKAALSALMEVYKSGKGINKDKKMEKLIKAAEENKLDAWLAENLKIEGK